MLIWVLQGEISLDPIGTRGLLIFGSILTVVLQIFIGERLILVPILSTMLLLLRITPRLSLMCWVPLLISQNLSNLKAFGSEISRAIELLPMSGTKNSEAPWDGF